MPAVKRIDRGLAAAVARTNALAGSGVKVGVQSGPSGEPGTDILDIAIWNEYGTRHIPARPFISAAAVVFEHDVGLIMVHLAKKVQNGHADRQLALTTLGERYQTMVRQFVRSGGKIGGGAGFAPNKASTIRRKGSSQPLIEHGNLVNSIRYQVVIGAPPRSWFKRLLGMGK